MKSKLFFFIAIISSILFFSLNQPANAATSCSNNAQCPNGDTCQGYKPPVGNFGSATLGTCISKSAPPAANPPANANPGGGTFQCTCNSAGTAGNGNNGYTCKDTTGKVVLTSSCSDSQSKNGGNATDACVTSSGSTIFQKQEATSCDPAVKDSGGCPAAPTDTYVGVACTNNPDQAKLPSGQASLTCACKGNSVQCTDNITHKNIENQACSSTQKCGESTNFVVTTSEGSARGAACVDQCKCQNNGVAGVQQNGFTCGNSGSVTYCDHQEDKCVNNTSSPYVPQRETYDPNSSDPFKLFNTYKNVTCSNTTKCGCDGNAIVCTSVGVGPVDLDGSPSDENFTYDCGDDQCVQGADPKTGLTYDDPNLTAFHQHVTGIKCLAPVTSPIPPLVSPPCSTWINGECTGFNSAFGIIQTDPAGFIQTIFGILLSASGGIALLLIMRSGYQLMTSQGNPEQVKNGRDQLIAAIVGLVFLIFSFVFLQLIGFDILHIPGFGGTDTGVTAQSCTAAGEQYCSSLQECYPISSTCP